MLLPEKYRSRLVLIIVIVFASGLFYALGKQIYDSLQADKRLDQAIEEVSLLQRQNIDLKKKLNKVESVEFIEQQARDKLNMARPNETVVLIPATEIEKILQTEQKNVETKIPNWQGWLNLFLK